MHILFCCFSSFFEFIFFTKNYTLKQSKIVISFVCQQKLNLFKIHHIIILWLRKKFHFLLHLYCVFIRVFPYIFLFIEFSLHKISLIVCEKFYSHSLAIQFNRNDKKKVWKLIESPFKWRLRASGTYFPTFPNDHWELREKFFRIFIIQFTCCVVEIINRFVRVLNNHTEFWVLWVE